MVTQADWRMMLGIRPQPNQWAEAINNLPGNLIQGLQIGDYFKQRSEENQLRELMRGAIDPQTGMPDQGKVIQAVMQTYPEKAPELMAEMRKQEQYEQSQNALQQFLTGSGAGTGAGGLATPPSVRALAVAGAGGQPEKALENLAGFENAWQLKTMDRSQELIPGVVNTPNGPVEVTDTRENWARYRQQLQTGTVPQGQPQVPTGQSGRLDLSGDHIMDKSEWDRLRTNDPEGARAFLLKMPLQQRNLFIQSMYAENGPQVTIPATSNQPITPMSTSPTTYPAAPVSPSLTITGLPPGAIQRGLSPAQQQAFKIQEEERAKQRQIEEEIRKNQAAKTAEEQSQANRVDLQVEKMYLDNDYAPIIKAGQAIPAQKAALAVQEKLLNTMNTGPGAEVLLKTKRFFAAFGISNDKIDADIANAEKLRGAALDNVNSLLSSFNGVQTEGDSQRAIEQYSSIDKTVEGNKFLVDYRKAVLDLTQKKVDFYTKARKELKRPSLVYEAWLSSPEVNLSVYDMPSMQKWKERLPQNVQGQPQPGSTSSENKQKVGTQQDVLDVARKLNISPDAALQKLKAAGWSIQ